MRHKKRLGLWLGLLALGAVVLVTSAVASGQSTSNTAYSIELSGTVDPATEGFLVSELDDAADNNAVLAIITIDTPGGLAESADEMVAAIESAPMPVVAFVTPDGARAEGAGVSVLEAADVAAIAPGATLVTDDGELSAEQALDAGLVDLVAAGSNATELIEQNGFAVPGIEGQELQTEELVISQHEMGLLDQLLQIIINPNVAYLLLLVGLAGVGIELLTPGLFVPGSLGVLSLLLGIYGAAQLPVTVIGVVLLLVGVGLVIAEAYLPTGGILGIGGIAALIAAGLTLFDTGSDALEVEVPIVVTVAVVIGGFGLFVGDRVLKAQRQKRVRTGWEELPGSDAEVRVALNPIGQIFVEGALWRARSITEGEQIPVGERVRVREVDGLTLIVERVESVSDQSSPPTEGA